MSILLFPISFIFILYSLFLCEFLVLLSFRVSSSRVSLSPFVGELWAALITGFNCQHLVMYLRPCTWCKHWNWFILLCLNFHLQEERRDEIECAYLSLFISSCMSFHLQEVKMHEIKCSHWSLFLSVSVSSPGSEARWNWTCPSLRAISTFHKDRGLGGGAVRPFRSVVFITCTAFHTSNYSSMLGALPAGSGFMYRASLPPQSLFRWVSVWRETWNLFAPQRLNVWWAITGAVWDCPSFGVIRESVMIQQVNLCAS
jgi:hypothetical protein